MNSMVWWILLLVVALIGGPFVTLATVSAFRSRRAARAARPVKDDEDGGSGW
jgi:hypothetical protein